MQTMNDSVVMITGAKGGLGTHVTRAFLNAGARVAGVSRSIQNSDFDHPAFTAFSAAIGNGAEARAAVDRVTAALGAVDVLVHLVGGFQAGSGLDATDDSVAESMLALNYWSASHMIRAVLPAMRDRGTGAILAIGSRAAVEAAPGAAAYAASKAALVSMIRSVAAEASPFGVSANIVLPGTMDTPANRASNPGADFGRWVDPAQVAALLVHLASRAGSNITGAAIPIYGRES